MTASPTLQALALEIADGADTIGCSYSTQMGEMPTSDEVDARLRGALAEATRASGDARKALLRQCAAFALSSEQPR